MTALHGLGSAVVLGAALLLAITAGIAAWLGGAPWVRMAGTVVTVLVGAEVILGAIAWIGGDRPSEALHYLYAIAALGAVPLAATFASEAPPRPRATVLAVAGLILAVLVWRLASTG